MTNLNVIEIARGANAFRRERWRSAIGPLGIMVIGSTLNALLGPSSAVAGSVAALVEGVGAVMAYAGLARLALADRHPQDPAFVPAASGFQWGRAEWLVLGFSLIGGAVVFLFALPSAVIAEALATPGRTGSAKAGLFLLLGADLCGLLYVLTRLTPGTVASIDRGRIAVGSTWRIMRGHMLPVLGASLLVMAVITGMTLVSLFAAVGLGALVAMLASQPVGAAVGGALSACAAAVIVAFAGVPLSVGVASYVYRTLAGPVGESPP